MTVEVPAPAAGVLTEIVAKDGETVGVGALLGQIAAGGSAPRSRCGREAGKPRASRRRRRLRPPTASRRRRLPASPAKAGRSARCRRRRPPPSCSPKHNLSADQVAGSGKRGQVLKGDVLAAIAKGPPPPAAAPSRRRSPPRAPSPADDAAREERVKMTRLRQTIARRLKEAQNTAAMLTTFNEVDMKAVMDLRNKYKDVFEKKHGVKLGFMGFFTKAVTHALKEIPAVNAEIDGTDIIYKNYCHIGVAVGTDKGLVVPVVRDADQMSIAEIEKEIGRLGARRPRRQAVHGRHAGRHVHHLQWRRLRFADVVADPQRAAVGHPRHAQDPGAPGRRSAARSSSAR